MCHLKAQTAQWSQDSTAVVQNLPWFETLLEAIQKNNWMNNHPPCLFLPGHPSFLLWHSACSAALLQQGILRDVYKAPDDSCGTAVWHTAGWFSARSMPLGQYTPYHKAPLTPRQTPAATIQVPPWCWVRRKPLQNWTHFYYVSAQRTGLQKLRKGYPWRLQKPSDLIASTAYMICTTFSRTVNEMTCTRTLSQDLSQAAAHRNSSTGAKCFKEFQATFPSISTSHTAHPYNFECYLNSCISSRNHSIKLREAKGHPRPASS